MRIVLIVLACVATLIGLIFIILPMGSIAVIPAAVGALLGYLALKKSEEGYKNPPRIIVIIGILLSIIGVSKPFFTKTEVAKDDTFELRVEDSQKEAIEELDKIEEELDDLPE